MFRDQYQKAYQTIIPSQELLTAVLEKAHNGGKRAWRENMFVWRAAFGAAAAVLCFAVTVPVCAAYVPACYQIVESFSPAVADRLVPIQESSTDKGITMQVEGINLEGNEAGIIISLRDAEDSTQDLVHGEMDLFDSYRLTDYTNESVVGGCYFLTYDEADDKVYFKVFVKSDNDYQSDKLQFSVRSILCNKNSDTRDVALSEIVYEGETKRVTLSGSGGGLAEDMLPESLQNLPGTADDPRPGKNVLDMMKAADCAADDFTVTGIAYMDGALRVQMCMGNNWKADRHVELFLKDSEGNERYPDHSVSWYEDAADTSYQFYEFWYMEEIENIEDYSMYGIFHDSGELIEGDWNVTFRVEE